ncbi:MAG: DUF1097 domain-containing protein [Candidatus Accumulibacter sp.]|nr:DUF1097 domain-containing protein [Accumulibacter sp.]
MNYLTTVGVTVGLLAGAWVYGAESLGMAGFAGFLGWASYFAAGGGKAGAIRAACCNMSGVLWGVVTVFLAGHAPIAVVFAAAFMCWQAKIPLLSFIPATFIGNACFHASGNDAPSAVAGLLCGIALGLVSAYAAKFFPGVRMNKR